MKKQIWKFPINHNHAAIEMPKDAEILTVQTQNETPCIWAMVNPENPKELRHFEIFGTGNEIYFITGLERIYINTFQVNNGSMEFHLFERIISQNTQNCQ